MARDQRNREKLLQTAMTLFHHRGFKPTSLDEVLERSGVCRSNFYYYFRSKEDLGLEVLQRHAEAFGQHVIRGILEDRSRGPRARLRQLFDVVRSEMERGDFRQGCPFGNLAVELCGAHPEFQARLSAFFWRWQEALERCLVEGMEAGEFRSDVDPRSAAIAVLSQIEGAVLLAKAHGDGAPIVRSADIMLQLLESR
jgi:TetR/AcrR family transcriptional repressor of nem operon